MKLTESKLKTLVTEEILLTLIENKESAKAKAFYLQNRELLDEGWLDKFVPMSLRSNWAQIEKDAEAEEKVEQAVKDLRKHKEFGKPRISDEDLKKVLTRWTQEKRTNLTSDEEEVIIKTLMQAKEKETQGAPSSKPEEEGDAGATGEEEVEAPAPAEIVKNLRNILKTAQGISAAEAPIVDFFADMIELSKISDISPAKFPELKKFMRDVRKRLKRIKAPVRTVEDEYGFELEEIKKRVLREVLRLITEKRQNEKIPTKTNP